MSTIFTTDSCPISGLSVDKNYKKYTISIKSGTYYTFDYMQISNQVHYHDCYELVIVLSGKGTFIYNKQVHILTKGDLFLSDPHIEHEIHIKPTDTLTVLYLFIDIEQKNIAKSQSFEEKLIESFKNKHENILHGQYQLMAYLSFFEAYAQNPKFKNSIWFLKTFENLVLNCLQLLSCDRVLKSAVEGKYEPSVFEKALDYIDQNLQKRLSAEIVANAICTSRRNLYVIFNKNISKTVHDYIYEKKISLAEHYLQMNLGVTETASLVGIENLTNFSRIFRKYKGISPREYIRQVIPNKQGYGRRHVKNKD